MRVVPRSHTSDDQLDCELDFDREQDMARDAFNEAFNRSRVNDLIWKQGEIE